LAGLLLALTVVFFPALFFGRVVSPMDTVESGLPWRNVDRPVEVGNPELEDPAVHFLPLAGLARRGLAGAVWNPFTACGMAGYLSWDAGVLAPTTGLLLPWTDGVHFAGGMVLLKLLLAFWGAWLLAWSEGTGEVAATTGGLVYALALPLSARWLWPSSATAAALPVLVWTVSRAVRSGRPWRWGLPSALAWIAFLAGGDPTVTVGGLYLLCGWALFLWIRGQRGRTPGFQVPLASGLVALALLAPSFALYRTAAGSAGLQSPAAPRAGLGRDGLRLLADPFALGDPRRGDFTPPPALEGYQLHDLAIGVGSVALALAVLGIASRRRGTGFWTVVMTAGLLAILWTPGARLLGLLPGLGREGPWALSAIPALAVALLAAWGAQALEEAVPSPTLRRWAALLAVAVVLQQGAAAGHLLTWRRPADAVLPATPSIRFLREATGKGPMRIAPLGDVLVPDTAQCFGLEDLRSSRGASAAYVRLLLAIDPQSSGHYGSGLRLNPATIDLTHPYLRALGARFLLEDPELHLVEFGLGRRTIEIEPRNRRLGPMGPGRTASIVQDLHLPAGSSRMALNASSRGTPVEGALEVVLHDEVADQPVLRRTVDAGALARDGFAWLDLPPRLATFHRMRLSVQSHIKTGRLWLLRTSKPGALDGPLLWNGRRVSGDLGLSFDTSGYVRAADGPELRLWENRHAGSRFWIVREIRPGSLETVVRADPPLDLRRVAVLSPGDADGAGRSIRPVQPRGTERLVLLGWTASRYTLQSVLDSPGLLVGSISARPSLWHAEIDGQPVEPITTDGVFLGVPLPSGTHAVTLYAALPGSWLAISGLGLAGLIGLGILTGRKERQP